MKKEFSICGLTLKNYGKIQDYVKILDTETKIPVTIINGKNEGKTVLITAGIHGGEYPCIRTAIELARDINPESVNGQIIIIHPVNMQAFKDKSAGIVPEDGKNINRVFPGDKNGTISDKIAYVLTHEFQDKCDFYFDMHGGDLHEELHPYVYYPGICEDEICNRSKEIAKIFNVDYMVKSNATSGAYNSAAIRGIPSILIERGGCGICRREEVEKYKKDMIIALRGLGVLEGDVLRNEQSPIEITNVKYIDSLKNGCLEMFVKAGERIVQGQKLYEVIDLFGNVIDTYYAEFQGIVLYNTVSLAINKGESIIAYGELNL